jgi:biotin carboxyl carrier protein
LAFLRFSRDKRGVENFYLVQPTTNRRGKVRPRILYWFRSPPDVKVGRQPFDPTVRRALELQNPGVEFDWRAIVETPIPSADADKWRERRRAERAARSAAADAEAEAEPEASEGAEEMDSSPPGSAKALAEREAGPDEQPTSAADVAAPAVAAITSPGVRNGDPNRKRRRRRRSGSGRDRTAAATPVAPSSDPIGD